MSDNHDLDVVALSVAAYRSHVFAYEADDVEAVKDAAERFANLLAPGSSILYAGCGPSRDLVRFKNLGHKPVGVDLNSDFVDVAQRHGETHLGNLPFMGASFDGVWACASLVHLPKNDVKSALHEFKRVIHKKRTRVRAS